MDNNAHIPGIDSDLINTAILQNTQKNKDTIASTSPSKQMSRKSSLKNDDSTRKDLAKKRLSMSVNGNNMSEELSSAERSMMPNPLNNRVLDTIVSNESNLGDFTGMLFIL